MEKKTRDSILVFSVFSTIFIVAGIYFNKAKNEINNNGIYSIGIITNKKYGLVKYYIDYEFRYKDSSIVSYKRISDVEVEICKKYNRFLVKFSPNNLKYDEIYFNYPVVEDSITAPSKGLGLYTKLYWGNTVWPKLGLYQNNQKANLLDKNLIIL